MCDRFRATIGSAAAIFPKAAVVADGRVVLLKRTHLLRPSAVAGSSNAVLSYRHSQPDDLFRFVAAPVADDADGRSADVFTVTCTIIFIIIIDVVGVFRQLTREP